MSRRYTKRDSSTGKFLKVLPVWTEETWDAGWIDNKGRFRVYRPDCPRAFPSGYALRAHVVYWLHLGICHPVGTVLHHVDENKLNDRFENLVPIEHGEHTRLHHAVIRLLTCENCKKIFRRPNRELSRKIRFCSQTCFHAHPRSEQHKLNIGRGNALCYAEGRR